MTITRFRQLIVLSIVLGFASLAASFYPTDYTDAIATAYGETPPGWLLSGQPLAIALILLLWCIVIASYIGLYRLTSWGRSLALWSTIAALALYPTIGPMLETPWEAMLVDASTMLWGAILALAYFSPVASRIGSGHRGDANSIAP